MSCTQPSSLALCRQKSLFLDVETYGRSLGNIEQIGVGSFWGEWVYLPRNQNNLTWLGSVLLWMSQSIIVGHNLHFDLRHLAAFFTRRGFSLPSVHLIDTLSLSRVLLPQQSSHALGFLTSRLGLDHHFPHTACGDVRATRALWCHLGEIDPVRASTPLPMRL